jgi:hypothetical protein
MKSTEIITANKHRSTVLIVSIVGVFLTIALFAWSWHLSLDEYRQRFNYDASVRSEMVVRSAQSHSIPIYTQRC